MEAPALSDTQLNALATELDTLYADTQASMGQADLDYIDHLKNYSLAIKKHSDELFTTAKGKNGYGKAIVLRGLHTLLEFSIGHVILHGAFDHLYKNHTGRFHSSHYQWQFAVDTEAWKTMHHQNHHPFTNIKSLDHDLGYGLFRISESQHWWGHHLIQYPLIAAILGSHSAYFSLYTSYSAGAINGKPWHKLSTYKKGMGVIKQEWLRSYMKEPLAASAGKGIKQPWHMAKTAVGNLLGNMVGYDYLITLLLLEHHSHNVSLYEPQKRAETKGEYYHRQILATTNFIPNTQLDLYLQKLLSEVNFANPPSFRVFYEALDTHLEHHLFPDLPGNRLREIVPAVQQILSRYGLPYHILPFEEAVPDIFKRLGSRTFPIAKKNETLLSLIKMPQTLAQRLYYGVTYRNPPTPWYLGKLRKDLTAVKVLSAKVVTQLESDNTKNNAEATAFTLALPKNWQHMTWPAGSFVSVQVLINGKNYIRQYSLTQAKTHSHEDVQTLDIVVKRIKNGVVSNYLNDHIKAGDTLNLYRTPQGESGFIMPLPQQERSKQTATNHAVSAPAEPTGQQRDLLLLAAGVGITPIMSMLRFVNQHYPKRHIKLLYFNRHPEWVIFKHEIADICKNNQHISVAMYYSPSSTLPKTVKQAYISKDLLVNSVPDISKRTIYVCAPTGFINKVTGYLRELDFDMQHFHQEMFKPPELVTDTHASYRYHKVVFSKSAKSMTINENTTLLAAAKKMGIPVMTGCERGLCKACVCSKSQGKTSLETDTLLDKITLCNAFARSDLVLNI